MTRRDVLKEYAFKEYGGYWGESRTAYNAEDMADEIVRLRRILAALREPSEAVLDAAYVRLYPGCFPEERTEFTTPEIRDAIRAAVAAAEAEASHGARATQEVSDATSR